MTESGNARNDEPHRRGRPVVFATLYVFVLVAAGVAIGIFGGGHRPVLLVVVMGLFVIGGGVGWGLYANRSPAREIGVPRRDLRPLGRRIQREDIPDDPAERLAMGLVLARQRRGMARLERVRWLYVLLTAVFLLNAVLQYLDGRILLAVMLLPAGVLPCAQPFATRRTLRRLDRVEAELTRRRRAAAA